MLDNVEKGRDTDGCFEAIPGREGVVGLDTDSP
jgi:hypothetical protein